MQAGRDVVGAVIVVVIGEIMVIVVVDIAVVAFVAVPEILRLLLTGDFASSLAFLKVGGEIRGEAVEGLRVGQGLERPRR